jgi:uncharacterized membrane protein
MELVLENTTRYVGMVIEAIAVIVIAIGVVEVLIAMVPVLMRRQNTPHRERAVWLSFAHWLVAGLTLQLAADIVQTTVAPTWNDIGHLAAIAAMRTFLSYFLDRDVETVRERQHRYNHSANQAKHS